MECGVTREWGRSALDRVIRYRLTEKLGSTRLRNHLRATVLATNSTGTLCTALCGTLSSGGHARCIGHGGLLDWKEAAATAVYASRGHRYDKSHERMGVN